MPERKGANGAPAPFESRSLPGPVDLAQIPQLVERGRRRALWFFGALDEELANRPYIVGEAFSVANVTALVTVDFARRAGLDVADKAVNLRRWYDRVRQRPNANA